MTDIVERLRAAATDFSAVERFAEDARLLDEAANEIERLRRSAPRFHIAPPRIDRSKARK